MDSIENRLVITGGGIERAKAGTCRQLVNQEGAEGRAWREERGL